MNSESWHPGRDCRAVVCTSGAQGEGECLALPKSTVFSLTENEDTI